MKIDLAGMIRRAGATRRPFVLGRAIIPTGAQELALLRIYARVLRGWSQAWAGRIQPSYARTIEGLPAIGDSVEDTRATVDDAAAAMTRLTAVLSADLEDWAVRVEEWHRRQFASSFVPAGVRLDTLLGRTDVQTPLRAVLADNVSLIRSLNDQMRNGISGAVFRGLTNRTPAREVSREIRKTIGLGKSRADLIAADQLQKLTARLDQERQEQCGLTKFRWIHSEKKYPRKEHVARNGKVYAWDSPVGKNDPPGRAIRCGCRAQPVVELDDVTAGEVEAQAPPPPAQPVEPPKPRTGFRDPVNRDVNAGTIKVAPRLSLQKRMRPDFAKNAADPRYTAREFRDRTEKDFGNVVFSAGFDDEAASMVAALTPELDALADQLAIPRLRGLKSISGGKAVANQGDGVMGLNPTYFNAYAENVGGRATGSALAEIEAKRDALKAQMAPLVAEIKATRARMAEVQYGGSEWQRLSADEADVLRRLRRLRDEDDKLWRKGTAARSHEPKAASTWKPGDGAKTRPFTVDAYFSDGVDKARSTLFHEFGHHVHQYLKKQGPRRQFGAPPLERDLSSYYRRELYADPNRILSKYGTTNEHEWFAESFSAYVMGRRDLLGPAALELLEGIFNGTY